MTDRLAEAALPIFARHETFQPRYGWFRKAVQAAQRSPTAFTSDDATVELGVGKNMVRAIRFWGSAAKLLAVPANSVNPRGGSVAPSINGVAMFDEDHGLDPYAELSGTGWVLHWWMLRPPSDLPVWWLALQRFNAVEFTEDELVAFVVSEIERSGWLGPNHSSIRKDVSCFLRMYTRQMSSRGPLEELIDCPMRELGLLEAVRGEQHRYRFVLGSKPTLPDLVLAYACLDWMSFRGSSAQTVGVRELAVTTGGPGRAFRITETEIVEGLGRASKLLPSVSLTSAAGVPQLISSGPPAATASDALGAYYRPDGHRAGLQIALGDGPYENSEKSESNIRNRRGRRDGGEDQRLDPATVGARTPITGAF